MVWRPTPPVPNSFPSATLPDELGPYDVEVKVTHCGVCHSDIHLIDNDWGISQYPFIPGHEIVGTVTAVGSDVHGRKRRPARRHRLAGRLLRHLRVVPPRRRAPLPQSAAHLRRPPRRLRRPPSASTAASPSPSPTRSTASTPPRSSAAASPSTLRSAITSPAPPRASESSASAASATWPPVRPRLRLRSHRLLHLQGQGSRSPRARRAPLRQHPRNRRGEKARPLLRPHPLHRLRRPGPPALHRRPAPQGHARHPRRRPLAAADSRRLASSPAKLASPAAQHRQPPRPPTRCSTSPPATTSRPSPSASP